MNSIKEALAAVKLYDQIHWTFKPGAESIRHVCISLMGASVRVLGYQMQLINLNIISSFVRPEWCAVMPGILIESACRLANNCPRVDFEDYIHQSNPFTHIRRREFERRILNKTGIESEKFADMLLVYFYSLTPLIDACEQIDNGKEFDDLYVLDVANELLDFAAEFCPDSLESLEDFFSILEKRLQTKMRV